MWKVVVAVGAAALVASALGTAPAQAGAARQVAKVANGGAHVHLMPPRSAGPVGAQPLVAPNLTYQGGPVMQNGTQVVPIYWQPAHLQSGVAATVDPNYRSLLQRFFHDFGGHALYNNLTQYYQTGPQYIVNSSGFLKAIVDTSAYPTAVGACSNSSLTNCITDGQLKTRIANDVSAGGLPRNLATFYPVFTDPGEFSCSANNSCYHPNGSFPPDWKYCAYHSAFLLGGQPVIYANMPYVDTNAASISGCAGSGPNPNGDAAFDDETSALSHEFNEAITDPELNAWWDTGTGNEIADICNAFTAQITWASHPYIVQQEWSVDLGACLQGASQQTSVSPTSGLPAATPTVSGTGFGPSEAIHLSFSDAAGNVTSLGTTASNPAGAFSSPVSIPAAVVGKGTIDATGVSPEDGASAAFGVLSNYRPDALIGGKKTGPFVGNGVYNTSGASQTLVKKVARGSTLTFWVQVQNDGGLSDTYSLKGPGAPPGFTVVYKVGTATVTTGVKAGTYHHLLGSHASFLLQVIVGVKAATAVGKTFKPMVTVASLGGATKKDAVIASAQAK